MMEYQTTEQAARLSAKVKEAREAARQELIRLHGAAVASDNGTARASGTDSGRYAGYREAVATIFAILDGE